MTRISSKFVASVTVTDPDTNLPVEVEIRKLETGAMVGLDGSFLANTDDEVWSPYDKDVEVRIPEDEMPA